MLFLCYTINRGDKVIKLSEINKEWYSPGELAKFVGRTSRTIQNHCDEGKIDFKRVNGRRNIPKSEVVRMFEESKMLIRDNGKKGYYLCKGFYKQTEN